MKTWHWYGSQLACICLMCWGQLQPHVRTTSGISALKLNLKKGGDHLPSSQAQNEVVDGQLESIKVMGPIFCGWYPWLFNWLWHGGVRMVVTLSIFVFLICWQGQS